MSFEPLDSPIVKASCAEVSYLITSRSVSPYAESIFVYFDARLGCTTNIRMQHETLESTHLKINVQVAEEKQEQYHLPLERKRR